MNSPVAPEKTVFDFQTATHTSSWQIVNDSVMGGVSASGFPTKKGEWEEHRLPMKEFVPTFRGRVLSGAPPLDATQVTSVGFLISDEQAGPFQLEIAWIKAASR